MYERRQLVDNECAPRSIWQLFHHKIPHLCTVLYLLPHNAHIEMSTISLFSPIDLALFCIHIFFYCQVTSHELLRSAKCNEFFCNAPDLFSFSPSFFDLWCSIWAAKDLNARSCEKTRRIKMCKAEHHDPFLVVSSSLQLHASSRMLWERKSFFKIHCMRQRVRA